MLIIMLETAVILGLQHQMQLMMLIKMDQSKINFTIINCLYVDINKISIFFFSSQQKIKTEQPIRPFACPIPGCTKRYKNVNGIKYHVKNGHTNGK